ncbi:MAG: TetR/AcrR family transcriptional regulator [Polyangiaceae bacterium]|nr:TetR/AcrR family transcriptional regulator [Polyangiaceae bacterium]
MVRQEAKAATRRAVREAAEQAFAERGYDRTSIADIARAAGVATGTFYVHFPSKEALLDELLGAFNAELAERVGQALGKKGTEHARVLAAAEAVLGACEAHRAFVSAYLERSRVGLEASALRDGINPPAYGLVRAAVASLGVGGEALELATHGLLALWLRVALQHVFRGAQPRAATAGVLADMTVGAVRALTPRRPRGRPTPEPKP